MARLAAIVQGHSGPWVALGDWNVEPEELKAPGGLTILQAVVRTPEEVSYNCTRGEARMLDYAMCLEKFQILVDSVSAVQVDPGDHYGVRLHLRGSDEAALQRKLLPPQSFSLPDLPRRQADPGSRRSRRKATAVAEVNQNQSSGTRTHEGAQSSGQETEVQPRLVRNDVSGRSEGMSSPRGPRGS